MKKIVLTFGLISGVVSATLMSVNMAFADGSCKVVSDQIAPSVYARLLSPMGGRYGQTELSDSDF